MKRRLIAGLLTIVICVVISAVFSILVSPGKLYAQDGAALPEAYQGTAGSVSQQTQTFNFDKDF
jgi:hypothetical protein